MWHIVREPVAFVARLFSHLVLSRVERDPFFVPLDRDSLSGA